MEAKVTRGRLLGYCKSYLSSECEIKVCVGLKSYARVLLGCGAKRPVSAFADKEQNRKEQNRKEYERRIGASPTPITSYAVEAKLRVISMSR